MKKKKWIIIGSIGFLILLVLTVLLILYLRVRFAKIEVTLKEDLTIPIRSKVKYSDFLISINGTLLEDKEIDTNHIGEQTITIHFKNEDGIKVKYPFNIQVVDNEAPIAWIKSKYTVYQGASDQFLKNIMCADNYDSNPVCSVNGSYDLNTIGYYSLEFTMKDESGNENRVPFQIEVKEKPKGSGSISSTPKTITYFKDVIEQYKTENTEIGLDISHWQGDIDFEKIKNAGVEFLMIRVGTSDGMDGEYILDKKFTQNIKKANELNIPVGIYFYSYANSEEKAIEDARWVLEQIKDYKIDLPIAFDWENWSNYNEFHLSLFGLSDMANAFLKEVEEAGYETMLYSSKSYLEKIWYPGEYKTWLAHYTADLKKTTYEGDYDFWQLCSDGAVNGISGDVDVNIRYKK